MICDFHTHASLKEIMYLEKAHIYSNVCAMDPLSAKKIIRETKHLRYINPTCAIHPHNSNKYSIEKIIPYLENVNIIGEIGMDSVWTTLNLSIQENIFIKQLEIAQMMNKPVIVHTKGQEYNISKILKNYTMEKIIHWYSCLYYLEEYIQLGCYFTVGPSILNDDVKIINLVKKVELDKILIESDGRNAINWALSTNYSIEKIEDVLKKMIHKIAIIKNVSYECVEKSIEKNFFKFFK